MNNLPKFHETFIPTLKILNSGNIYHKKDLARNVRDTFYNDLPKEVLNKTYEESGKNALLDRIGWGLSYLRQANLIIYPQRGYVQITEKGRKVLEKGEFTFEDLKRDEDWSRAEQEKIAKRKNQYTKAPESDTTESTPEELISQATAEIESEVQSQILDEIQKISYKEFETLVVKLLVAMGYGKEEFSTNTSYTNDGGIDGIIQADKLGFDRIYVQAKKHTGNIGRPDIQKFVGAMTGTQKGVFITTSDFAKSVQEYISTRPESIMLINEQELVELMYKYNQGVSLKSTIEIKSLDSDFWEELS